MSKMMSKVTTPQETTRTVTLEEEDFVRVDGERVFPV